MRWPVRPRDLTGPELRRAGVVLNYNSWLTFECLQCGRTWKHEVDDKGKLPRCYWKCPRGCNDGLREPYTPPSG